MANKVVVTSFLGTCAIITFRDFKQPDPNWPLGPVPPPYRYTWAAVAFGLCALVADVINEKIGEIIAGGLLVGTAFAVATKQSSTAGLKANPKANIGQTNQGAASTPKGSKPVTQGGTAPTTSNGQKLAGNNNNGSVFWTGGGLTP